MSLGVWRKVPLSGPTSKEKHPFVIVLVLEATKAKPPDLGLHQSTKEQPLSSKTKQKQKQINKKQSSYINSARKSGYLLSLNSS